MRLLKKMTAFILTSALIVGVFKFSAQAASFSDTGGHWAEKAIEQLVGLGVLSGRGDAANTFDPNGSVTRAEFCVILNRAFKLTAETAINFTDIAPDDPYYQQISRGIAAGYLSGYTEDDTVRPNAKVTRNEAAVMLSKLLKLPPAPGAADKFTDAKDIPSWAKQYVESVAAVNIMGSYPDGTFGPSKNLTRGEICSQVSMAIGYYEAKNNKVYLPVAAAPPIDGDITISADYGKNNVTTINGTVTVTANGITLKNLSIKGDLIIDPSSGKGTIHLINVNVEGKLYIKGDAKSVYLTGNADKVEYSVPKGSFRLSSGNIDTFTLTKEAEGSRVYVANGGVIGYADIGAVSSLRGKGEITKADFKVYGITADKGLVKSYGGPNKPTASPSVSGTDSGGGGSSSSDSGSSSGSGWSDSTYPPSGTIPPSGGNDNPEKPSGSSDRPSGTAAPEREVAYTFDTQPDGWGYVWLIVNIQGLTAYNQSQYTVRYNGQNFEFDTGAGGGFFVLSVPQVDGTNNGPDVFRARLSVSGP